MKTRLEILLEKYWEAESSLDEERELKSLLKSANGFKEEKALFGILEDIKNEAPRRVQFPELKRTRAIQIHWLGWAASVAMVASAAWFWQDYEQKKQEELAYHQVMEALALIKTNLSKGQEQMQPLNDLKYLNTPNQLFQTTSQK